MRRNDNQYSATGKSNFPLPTFHLVPSAAVRRRAGFTLVELLVVIAIIGILAALLLAAVGPAIDRARRAQIGTEMEQFNTAIEDYKINVGSYPPNAQTDAQGEDRLDHQTVLSNFKRHFNKAFPQNQEPPALINGLVGLDASGNEVGGDTPADAVLGGGMNAAEALVFWLGGFSDDPKYPITGPGGPSYSVNGIPPNDQHKSDPIENRSWISGVNIEQLGPRDEEGFYPRVDDSGTAYNRYIVYTDPRDGNQRRINFWVLIAPKLETPYLYFDASRGNGANSLNDTPAVTGFDGTTPTNFSVLNTRYAGYRNELFENLERVYSIKAESGNANASNRLLFANDGKFQILHPGTDDAWVATPRAQENATGIDDLENPITPNNPFESIYPTGPWDADLFDTLTNFTEGRLGDEQE